MFLNSFISDDREEIMTSLSLVDFFTSTGLVFASLLPPYDKVWIMVSLLVINTFTFIGAVSETSFLSGLLIIRP